ncbi:hypothetical protein HDZ31DRAFT_66918 [Schizophyllum fasciatum]
MANDTPKGPYIREAKLPEEVALLGRTSARAFASHPAKNYFTGQKTAMHLQEGGQKAKNLRRLAHFEESILRSVMLIHGRIMVVAVPEADGKERIAACAAWIPPKSADMDGLLVLIRAKFHRSLFAWGLNLLKRTTGEYLPGMSKRRAAELKKQGIKDNEYWHLELLFTNPDDEGHGYCGKLLREQEAHDPTRLFTLDASSERSIGIYHHYGWTTYDQFRLGPGKAAEDGTVASGEKAKGVPVELMYRKPTGA